MFASATKKTITVGDITIVIRKLSATGLDAAREARQLAVTAMASRLGPDLIRAFREMPTKTETPTTEPVVTNDYSEFDRLVTLQKGIVSWDAKDNGRAVDIQKGIQDLDEDAAELIFHEIVDLSRKQVDPKEN